ncbi:hypothetical protein EQ500_06290 [Lactobacillus sp. XV13L]|nr:hypothetical protein [Lactobacillus sp. XV13L]
MPKTIRLVGPTKWRALSGRMRFVTFLRVRDFKQDYPTLLKIQQLQLKENADYADLYNASKPSSYKFISNFSGGFAFMGFFLGLAFLTMLASTLMFKVLSGAASDAVRYKMLHQMGTRAGALLLSIKQEIGALFLLPALLGIIDVLFGLKLFRTFLPYPYHNIWIPFTVFLILYMFYYFLTVKLYEKIVLDYK